MEKKNNSGILVGILIGIIIMLLVVGGLFATGTIGFKTNKTADNRQGSENNQINETNNNTVKDNKEETEDNNLKDNKEIDYTKFIGTWHINGDSQSYFYIENITENKIKFSWLKYRIARIDEETIDFSNGKAYFYFQGTKENFSDGKKIGDTEYKRKATIELTEDGVNFIIEDVQSIEQDKLLDFIGSVYIEAHKYTFQDKS